MRNVGRWELASAILLLCAATAIASPAQTFTTLAAFDGTNGILPVGPLAQGVDGDFYGTAEYGGMGHGSGGCLEACGTAFKITSGGLLTSFYSFCAHGRCADGGVPRAGLVLAADGSFYGTNSFGGDEQCDPNDGCGTVFRITPVGVLTTLQSFNGSNGATPEAGLVQGTGGSFYGVTNGANSRGTAFKITPSGALTTLYSFCAQLKCTDGDFPSAALIQANDGNFYGTTSRGGGSCDCGTVFRLTPGGKLTTLHRFNILDGAFPSSAMVQGIDGNLYGMTSAGGSNSNNCANFYLGCGTVFQINSAGTLTTIYNFCQQANCADGVAPTGLLQTTDGTFYGTTSYGGSGLDDCQPGIGCGTVFKLTPGGTLTTIHTFVQTDGAQADGLLQGTNGTFYGTTSAGGAGLACAADGCGTVYSLSVGLEPFVAFVHDSGKVGQTGGILGQGFTGTTSVSLNGTPAAFTVKSDTFIEATVPPGATTGFVTVTTPTGTLTSNVPFHVLK